MTYLKIVFLFLFLPTYLGAQGSIQKLDLKWQGKDREVLVRMPTKPMDHKRIVMVLHGGGGTARGMLDLVDPQFLSKLDTQGILSIWPQAHDKNWNDGRLGWKGAEEKALIDDVGFLKEVVKRLIQQHSLESPRVYGVGISNGGMMCYRLAADAPGFMTALAAVSSTLPSQLIHQKISPLPVLIIQGAKDPVIPIAGGDVKPFGLNRGKALSLVEIASWWAQTNQANGPALLTREKNYTIEDYPSQVPLRVIVFSNGGHTWPGGKQYLGKWLIGETPREVNTSDLVWNFFWG